jgi:pyruvate dehydrogenase E2 component (dihydrolipoamide acetyltransferase)
MPVNVTMPQLGETITEGTITKWLKAIGDFVELDQPFYEVATDKVDTEVLASVAGVLLQICVDEGQTVDVGTIVAVLGDDADDGSGTPDPAVVRDPAKSAAVPAVVALAPVPEAAPPQPQTPAKFLSPVVRSLVREHSVDPSAIAGSGADGRVTRSDVLALLDTRAVSAPATASNQPVGSDVARVTRAPVAPQHVGGNTPSSARAFAMIDIDFDQVQRAQSRFEANLGADTSRYVQLAYVTRAVVDALHAFPLANSTMDGDEAGTQEISIGLRLETHPDETRTPAVRHAGRKALRSLIEEIADLDRRAKLDTLLSSEVRESSFVIDGVGLPATVFTPGSSSSTASLSVALPRPCPVAVQLADGSYAVAIHLLGTAILTFDPLAFDAAYSASFLALVKDAIETRTRDGEW